MLLRGERSGRARGLWSLDRKAPRGLGLALAAALILTAGVVGAVRGGQYQAFVAEHGRLGDYIARKAGFGVSAVTISGIARLDQREVLALAGITPKNALPFFDVDAARAALLKAPLVASAGVRKLYPNRLAIDIVERGPVALWQRDGEVSIVSADGAALDELKDARLNDLPFVVGEGANKRLKEYLSLLDAAEELKDKIEAGVFVAQTALEPAHEDRRRSQAAGKRSGRGGGDAGEARTLVAHPRTLAADARPAHAGPRLRAADRRRRRRARAKTRGQAEEGGQDLSALAPRLRPLHPRKSAVLSVLDVGGSKVVCLIAKLVPMEPGATLARAHASLPGAGGRPAALARRQGRRHRRSRRGRERDPARRRRRRAHGRRRGRERHRQHVGRPAGDAPARRARRLRTAVAEADTRRVLEAAAQAGANPARAAAAL